MLKFFDMVVEVIGGCVSPYTFDLYIELPAEENGISLNHKIVIPDGREFYVYSIEGGKGKNKEITASALFRVPEWIRRYLKDEFYQLDIKKVAIRGSVFSEGGDTDI